MCTSFYLNVYCILRSIYPDKVAIFLTKYVLQTCKNAKRLQFPMIFALFVIYVSIVCLRCITDWDGSLVLLQGRKWCSQRKSDCPRQSRLPKKTHNYYNNSFTFTDITVEHNEAYELDCFCWSEYRTRKDLCCVGVLRQRQHSGAVNISLSQQG